MYLCGAVSGLCHLLGNAGNCRGLDPFPCGSSLKLYQLLPPSQSLNLGWGEDKRVKEKYHRKGKGYRLSCYQAVKANVRSLR